MGQMLKEHIMNSRNRFKSITAVLALIFILAAAALAAGCSGSGSETDTDTSTDADTADQSAASANELKVSESVFSQLDGVTFQFSSGAGGWDTILQINSDGTFQGRFHDSEMGSVGPDYPDGVLYECDFKGVFTDPEKIDDYTYSMKLGSVTYLAPKGQYAADGILHETSYPYGLENSENFYLYLPGKNSDGLPEGFRSWMLGVASEEDYQNDLKIYGLYNIDQQYGFAGYKRAGNIDPDASSAVMREKMKAISENPEDFDLFADVTVSVSGGNKTISTDAFSITLPNASTWDFKCTYNSGTLILYTPSSVRYSEDSWESGGKLVELNTAEPGETWYKEWGQYYELGKAGSRQIVANFPTDVQWNTEDANAEKEYKVLNDILRGDTSWFTLK